MLLLVAFWSTKSPDAEEILPLLLKRSLLLANSNWDAEEVFVLGGMLLVRARFVDCCCCLSLALLLEELTWFVPWLLFRRGVLLLFDALPLVNGCLLLLLL